MLNNSIATQSLDLTGGKVLWLRSGSLPELEYAYFQTSADDISWTTIGIATRTAGGWVLPAVTLPNGGYLRALGRTRSGQSNSSTGLVEQKVSLGSSAVQTYSAWADANLPPGARLPGDLNGSLAIPNLLAYALGIPPATATPQDLPVVTRNPSAPAELKFTYTRSKTATGINYEVQSSIALASWPPATLTSHMKVSENTTRETWEATLSTAGLDKLFVKLSVKME